MPNEDSALGNRLESGYGGGMSLSDRFRRAHHARQNSQSADALPTTLVEACGEVLEVDGVGISLTGDMRVPLAATSVDAVTAEALQTTIGEGPCLTAAAHGTRLVADATSMAATWPVFASALTSRTPFRSAASVPLRTDGGSWFGAVDLYSTDSDATTLDVVIDDAARIAELMAVSLMYAAGAPGSGDPVARWMLSPTANGRFRVWNAVGMMMAHAGEPSRDALARLRSYAFSHNLTLDAVADRLAEHELRPETIT
jgi:hypothetical protein